MRQAAVLRWGAATPVLACAAACGLGEGGIPDLYPVDGGPGTGPSDPSKPVALATPILDPPTSAVTCAEEIAITGRAAPGQTVVGTTPRGTWVATSNAQTGRFCVPVGLGAGVNAISVYVMGDRGQSPAANQSVTRQAGCGASAGHPGTGLPIVRTAASAGGADSGTGAPVRVVKVVSEATPTQALPPLAGTADAMVDGKIETFARYQTETAWDWDFKPVKDIPLQIHLALDKPSQVSSVKLVWREARASSGKTYASEYQVAVAAGASPGELPSSGVSSSDPEGWQFVGSKLGGVGGEELVDLSGAKLPTVRSIVLRLVEDGHSFTWNETFELAEIRVNVVGTQNSSALDNVPPTVLMPTAGGICSQVGY